jgi:hypothetical protein
MEIDGVDPASVHMLPGKITRRAGAENVFVHSCPSCRGPKTKKDPPTILPPLYETRPDMSSENRTGGEKINKDFIKL